MARLVAEKVRSPQQRHSYQHDTKSVGLQRWRRRQPRGGATMTAALVQASRDALAPLARRGRRQPAVLAPAMRSANSIATAPRRRSCWRKTIGAIPPTNAARRQAPRLQVHADDDRVQPHLPANVPRCPRPASVHRPPRTQTGSHKQILAPSQKRQNFAHPNRKGRSLLASRSQIGRPAYQQDNRHRLHEAVDHILDGPGDGDTDSGYVRFWLT